MQIPYTFIDNRLIKLRFEIRREASLLGRNRITR